MTFDCFLFFSVHNQPYWLSWQCLL